MQITTTKSVSTYRSRRTLPESIQKFAEHYGFRRPDHATCAVARLVLEETAQSKPRFVLQPMFDRSPVELDRFVRVEEMAYAGSLTKHSDQYRITVNAVHARGRQRFSVAHELGHTFFVPFSPATRYRVPGTAHDSGIEERLCNLFATCVLMPEDCFSNDLSARPLSPESVISLSDTYDVSVQAAAIRTAELAPTPLVTGLVTSLIAGKPSRLIWSASSPPAKRHGSITKVRLDETICDAEGAVACAVDIHWQDGYRLREVICRPLGFSGWLFATPVRAA